MYFPPGYLSRANASLAVFAVVLAIGILVVGVDASDTELQIVAGTAFAVAMGLMVFLVDRFERRQERDGAER
jgi:low affinity Fe/Cu permease